MAGNIPPPYDSEEPLELHDPVPDFGDLSGSASSGLTEPYAPPVHPCQTCQRYVTTVFHLAPVVVEEPAPGKI